jgi:hypothetical protein
MKAIYNKIRDNQDAMIIWILFVGFMVIDSLGMFK